MAKLAVSHEADDLGFYTAIIRNPAPTTILETNLPGKEINRHCQPVLI